MKENEIIKEPDRELQTDDLDQVSGGVSKNYKFTIDLKVRLYIWARDQKRHHGYSLPDTINRAKHFFIGQIKWPDIEDFFPNTGKTICRRMRRGADFFTIRSWGIDRSSESGAADGVQLAEDTRLSCAVSPYNEKTCVPAGRSICAIS